LREGPDSTRSREILGLALPLIEVPERGYMGRQLKRTPPARWARTAPPVTVNRAARDA
jgi:hypothetical protein